MRLRKWFHRVQWANVLLLGAQVLNDATQTFPVLQSNKYVLIAQGVLAAVLPSLAGISHKVDGTAVVETTK